MQEQPSESNLKTCLECGEALGPGRGDRKFCNDICRTAYNNKNRASKTATSRFPQLFEKETYFTRKVYQRLLANRDILLHHFEILGDQTTYRDLQGRGFNFKFFTSVYDDPIGFTQYFCFDYGYCIQDQKVYILYRPEETQ